jgi:aryl-alcohol dehydrogenase-like predicted oxidoreductase
VYRNSRPWSVRWEVEQSLKRLDLETIDLVQVHWHDPTTPIVETMGMLLQLRQAGELRAIGVSNYSPQMMEEAQRALGDFPLASDQPRYSLLNRDIEREIAPWCARKQVGLLAYSPLEQGLLSGKVRGERTFPAGDERGSRPEFTAENRERVNALLDAVVAPIAGAHGATLAQVVLAWTASQPGITSVLAGARTAEQAQENAAAGDLALTATELAGIRAAFERLELDLPAGRGRASGLKRLVKRLLGR